MQKWESSIKTILAFIFIGLIIILALILPSEKVISNITIATGDDSSSIVINYMIDNYDLKASKAQFETKTMGDC